MLIPTIAGTGLTGAKVASGALTMLIPTVAGVGEAGRKTSTGALTMLVPTVAGTGKMTYKATGALTMLVPTMAGVGEAGRKTSTGALSMLIPTVAGVGNKAASTKTATGALSMLIPTMAGVGVAPGVSGTGALSMLIPTVGNPALGLDGGLGAVIAACTTRKFMVHIDLNTNQLQKARYPTLGSDENTILDDTHDIVLMDGSVSSRTVTLPAVADSTGKVYVIKKVDSSSGTITIDGNGSETIDGATTKILAAQYDSVTIVCDGTEWHII